MSLRKTIVFLSLPLICAAFLSSQDLVELAKKEKARRAKQQEKKTTVVTNKDLKRVQVRSSVSSRASTASESETPVTTIRSAQAKLAGEADPGNRAVRVTVAQNVDQAEGFPEISLEEKWRRADNRVGHLNLKLTQLGQQFYNAETRERKAQIQSQIDRTSRELVKVKMEAEKFKDELDKQGKK